MAEEDNNKRKKRLEKEKKELDSFFALEENKEMGVKLEHQSENLWFGQICGPPDSVYEGGLFHFNITFPDNYPFQCPHIYFMTKIFHLNIENFEPCFPAWTPSTTIKDRIWFLYQIMKEVNPGSGNVLYKLFSTDREKYDRMAREHTKKHARKDQKRDWLRQGSHAYSNLESKKEEIIKELKLHGGTESEAKALVNAIESLNKSGEGRWKVMPIGVPERFSMYFWRVALAGPKGSPYEGVWWEFEFIFNRNGKNVMVAIVSDVIHPMIAPVKMHDGKLIKPKRHRLFPQNSTLAILEKLDCIIAFMSGLDENPLNFDAKPFSSRKEIYDMWKSDKDAYKDLIQSQENKITTLPEVYTSFPYEEYYQKPIDVSPDPAPKDKRCQEPGCLLWGNSDCRYSDGYSRAIYVGEGGDRNMCGCHKRLCYGHLANHIYEAEIKPAKRVECGGLTWRSDATIAGGIETTWCVQMGCKCHLCDGKVRVRVYEVRHRGEKMARELYYGVVEKKGQKKGKKKGKKREEKEKEKEKEKEEEFTVTMNRGRESSFSWDLRGIHDKRVIEKWKRVGKNGFSFSVRLGSENELSLFGFSDGCPQSLKSAGKFKISSSKPEGDHNLCENRGRSADRPEPFSYCDHIKGESK